MGSPSVSPTSTMADWSDSHYAYVKARILAINPTRVFSGIVHASDWPSVQAIPESFYLVTNTLDPFRSEGPGTGSVSASSLLYGETVSWVWAILGTDIQAGTVAANRGDRYRTNLQMVQEIIQGWFPGFCQKQQFSINQANGALIATPYVPAEQVWFSPPKFSTRIERSTGIMFGSAATIITGFAPTITG